MPLRAQCLRNQSNKLTTKQANFLLKKQNKPTNPIANLLLQLWALLQWAGHVRLLATLACAANKAIHNRYTVIKTSDTNMLTEDSLLYWESQL
jgi:hypothetical protein